ncbi:MAG: hypothetical protein U0804_18950 [Gemmataceae bacterium]
MARCPVCDAEAPADPPPGEPVVCRGCGRHFDSPPSDAPLPVAADVLKAIPVRPPLPRRRREPEPPPMTEAQAALGIRWAVIAAGLLVLATCVLSPLLLGPAPVVVPQAK